MTVLSTPSWELYDAWAQTVAEFGTAYPHGSGPPTARTIERNGGVLEDVRDMRRYWITL